MLNWKCKLWMVCVIYCGCEFVPLVSITCHLRCFVLFILARSKGQQQLIAVKLSFVFNCFEIRMRYSGDYSVMWPLFHVFDELRLYLLWDLLLCVEMLNIWDFGNFVCLKVSRFRRLLRFEVFPIIFAGRWVSEFQLFSIIFS